MVIDGHSHIGWDSHHGDSDINDYIQFAKASGIDAAILMLVVAPCHIKGDPNSVACQWKYENGHGEYYGKRNPFYELNYDLYEMIQQKSSPSLRLGFAAYFHPRLDDPEVFDRLLYETTPVAVKIHAFGCGIGPKDVGAEFIDIIRNHDLPVIVHTSYEKVNQNPRMHEIRNLNNPIYWADFVEKNRIRGVLNHGATLDIETFKRVNASDYLMVALGPERITCANDNRLRIPCSGNWRKYLGLLHEHLDYKKIIYDADFNWNVFNGEAMDTESVSRVKEIFSLDYEQKAILAENLLGFMPRARELFIC